MDLLVALQNWWSQPHFWFAVALPALLATIAARRHRPEMLANLGVWLVGTALSVASAYSNLRPLLGLAPDPYGVYALPIFPVAYLIAGRYRVASRGLCAAGTFLSLLAVDVVVAVQRFAAGAPDAAATVVGIGARQPVDGLIVVPLGAALAAWQVGRLQRQGVDLRLFKSRLSR